MPAPLLPLLLRTLVSRLLLPAARLARRHLLPLLRGLARRLGSQEVREALLGCLLFILSQRHPPDAEEASRVAGQERKERLAPPNEATIPATGSIIKSLSFGVRQSWHHH